MGRKEVKRISLGLKDGVSMDVIIQPDKSITIIEEFENPYETILYVKTCLFS